MANAKRVLIADDHAIFREGLKQVIAKVPGFEVAGEAMNAQEVLNLLRSKPFDIVTLDISMSGRDGLDIMSEIKDLRPGLPVLVISMHPEEKYAMRAFKSGASGYVTKGSPMSELVEALQRVTQGRNHISQNLAEALVSGLMADQPNLPHNDLSNREYQVLCMIASGKPVSRIADELALSVKTISTYRTHILGKMKMKNNAELTRYAIENELV